MSVLIFFALWFLSGYICFRLGRDELDTNWDMITATMLGGWTVLFYLIGWLITTEWADKPYK